MKPAQIAAAAMSLASDERAAFLKQWSRSWPLGTWHHLQHVLDWRMAVLYGGCPEDGGPELCPIVVLRILTSEGKEIERFSEDLDRYKKRKVLLPPEAVAAFQRTRDHLSKWIKQDGAAPYPEPPLCAQTSGYVAADVDRRRAT